MALRAGYQGFKKLLPGLKLFRPGCLGIDNAELSKTFYPRSEESLMGATNILPTSIASPTVGEATATLNADKSVTVNTSGATAADRYIIGSDYFTVPAGTWYFSGNKSENTAIDIYMQKESDGSVLVSNNATDPTPKVFTLESATSARLIIKVKNGQTVSNKTVYPMIALSADAPYAPYVMTNKELTAISQPTNDIIKVGRLAVVNKKIILTEPLTTSWNNAHPDFADFPSPVQNTTALCYSGGNWFNILFSEGINVASNSAIASGSTVYVTCAYITKS